MNMHGIGTKAGWKPKGCVFTGIMNQSGLEEGALLLSALSCFHKLRLWLRKPGPSPGAFRKGSCRSHAESESWDIYSQTEFVAVEVDLHHRLISGPNLEDMFPVSLFFLWVPQTPLAIGRFKTQALGSGKPGFKFWFLHLVAAQLQACVSDLPDLNFLHYKIGLMIAPTFPGRIKWTKPIFNKCQLLLLSHHYIYHFFVRRKADSGILCPKLPQSRPTLCNPMNCSPPGSSIHGIFQARVLQSSH